MLRYIDDPEYLDLEWLAIRAKQANLLYAGATGGPGVRLVSQRSRTSAFIKRWPVWRSRLL